MKSLKLTMATAALFATAAVGHAQTAQEPVTITVSSSTGELTQGSSASANWKGNWVSTATNPQLTLAVNQGGGNANNISKDYTSEGYLRWFVGSGSSIEFRPTSGWYVSNYTLKAKLVESGTSITANPNGRGAVTLTDDYQDINVDLTEGTDATIALSGDNKGLVLADFTVTLTHGTPVTKFETTTIADGEFAADTKWYTMQIAAAGRYIVTNTDGSTDISETTTMLADNGLWCFVGNDADGYTVYNRAHGTAKQFAAPTNPQSLGTNGGTAYLTMETPGVSGKEYLWDFTESQNLAPKKSWYISVHDHASWAINNRDGHLAFWTSGKDAGSSVQITEVDTDLLPVLSTDGTKLYLNKGKDCYFALDGGTVTANADGTFALSAGQWQAYCPDGKVYNKIVYTTSANSTATILGNQVNNNDLAIIAPITLKTVLFALQDPLNGYVVFKRTGVAPYKVQYRIPAITTITTGEYAGRLVAVNDYRHCGGDIGAGRIDLHMSVSDDNGITWSEPYVPSTADSIPVAQGTGAATPAGTKQSETNLDCGFGDPAIVADRETGELFMISCCGRMGFFQSTREDPQPSARWWSKDGGQTWTEADYGQWEQIYALFDDNCAEGKIVGQFIGSGRMVQSSRIKVGTHYRVYAVMSGRMPSGTICNWVLYTDDFGKNWNILGDPLNPAVPNTGDEPKCEELPDGSVLLAARRNGANRHFNIFRYTDIAKAEGRWGNCVATNMGMGGINACNGEIMIQPVKNTATGEKGYIALQSFPYGGSRANVSIAWKPLMSAGDFDEPNDFTTWNGRYQVSNIGSAYSTMTWTADNKVGFFYEEETFGTAYSEIFVPLTIEQITSGAYEYCPDEDAAVRNALTEEALTARSTELPETGIYVGMPSSVDGQAVTDALDAYKAAPTYENIAAFNAALEGAGSDIIVPEHGTIYRFTSAHDGQYASFTNDIYLTMNEDGKLTATENEEDAGEFVIVSPTTSDHYYLYNELNAKFVPATPNRSTEMTTVDDYKDAAQYNFVSSLSGRTSIVCQAPAQAGYPAIHLSGSKTIVVWTTDAAASKWLMEPVGTALTLPKVEEESRIADVEAPAPAAIYDLQGRRIAAPAHGLYIQGGKVMVK